MLQNELWIFRSDPVPWSRRGNMWRCRFHFHNI